MTIRETAPAKINLTLRVTGRRADGYHLLDSLVAFADAGEWLEGEAAEAVTLDVEGPFANSVPPEDNTVLRMVRAFQAETGIARGVRLRLHKAIPAGAGLGGGSADAAAALRLLERLWDMRLPEGRREALALGIGADVPVCLDSRPRRMRGVGERLDAAPPFGPLSLVLVHPGTALSTPSVFRQFQGGFHAEACPPAEDMRTWISGQANDLESAARSLLSDIGQVLDMLGHDARPARMSGSGSACFGLYESRRLAEKAAERLRAARPEWWVRAVVTY